MKLRGRDCLAFEDSANGLRAATRRRHRHRDHPDAFHGAP